MEKQKNYVKNLLELVNQNPNLRVVPMVEYEVCGGDECPWWEGEISSSSIEEIVSKDEFVYIKSKDKQKLIEDVMEEDFLNVGFDVSEEEAKEHAMRKVNAYDWEKVIVVRIVTP